MSMSLMYPAPYSCLRSQRTSLLPQFHCRHRPRKASLLLRNGKSIYVTHGLGVVSLIDAGTAAVLETIPVGIHLEGIAITPDARHAYAADASGAVSVIDIQTNTVVATLSVPIASPRGIAITPDGKSAYITHRVGGVSVLDVASNSVLTTIPLGRQNDGIAITPDGKHAYVADFGSDTLLVLDTRTNMAMGRIPVDSQGPGHPFGVAIDPDGKRACVTSTEGHVCLVDITSNAALGVFGGSSSGAGVAIASIAK